MRNNFVLSVCIFIAGAVFADLHIPSTPDLRELAHRHVRQCGDRFHLNNATRERLVRTERIAELHVTRNIQCFMKCLIDKSDFAENGELNEKKFLAVLTGYGQDEVKMRNKFATCKYHYSTGGDCSKLFNMYLCFDGVIP